MTCGLQALFIKSPRSNQCASWVPWGYSEESYNPIWDSLVWKASQLRVPAASRLRPCHILDGLGYFWFVFSLYPSPLPSLSLSFPSSPSSLLLSSLHQVELARWLPLLWSIVCLIRMCSGVLKGTLWPSATQSLEPNRYCCVVAMGSFLCFQVILYALKISGEIRWSFKCMTSIVIVRTKLWYCEKIFPCLEHSRHLMKASISEWINK